MKPATILALSLLSCPAARAADAPAAPSSSKVNVITGVAGGGRRGGARPPGTNGSGGANVEDRVSGAGAEGPGIAGFDAPKGRFAVFHTYQSLPNVSGRANKLLDFGTAPGAAFSVGFRAQGGDGTWAWVEDIGSTANCYYLAWLSKKPGGKALPGVPGAELFKACGYFPTQWTGGEMRWRTSAANRWDCPLKEGESYYFNILLQENMGTGPCKEHLTPLGSSQPYIFRQ